MTAPGKGLYAPRFVDVTFLVMGLGSAALLVNNAALANLPLSSSAATSLGGWLLLGSVALVARASCFAHAFDRRGWDDYMGQIVTQSSMIGMVTVLLSGVLWDFLLAPQFGLKTPTLMIQGMVPIAAFSWSVGYGFLRWKGTNS